MADRELPLQDLLGFMDDDERARWDSGTEEQRAAIRKDLTPLWYAIPDPTEEQLKPPYMHATDWSSHQNGSKDVLPFYTRKWKKDRKAKAREEQTARPDSNPPELEKPAKKGVDLFKLAKRLEDAEKENPPTSEELAKRKKRIEDIAKSLRLPEVRLHDFSSLIESLKKDEEETRKRFADAAKPPEWPAFDVDAYPPPLADWSKAENERRKADAEANALAMERAIDNALKKAEERAHARRELEDMGTRLGFPPVGSPPIPPPKEPPKPESSGRDKELSRPGDKRHTEWLWAATGVLVTILALVFWGFLFVFAWGLYAVGVYKAPWFTSSPKEKRFGLKMTIDALLACGLLAIWWFAPNPFATKNKNEQLASNELASPTPLGSTMLLPSPTPRPAASEIATSPGTLTPESAQFELEGGKRYNVLAMFRLQEKYRGPGMVLQFEVIVVNSGELYAGGANVSDKTGLPIEQSRYWQQVDIRDLYFYMPKSGRVAVTFVWLKPLVLTPSP